MRGWWMLAVALAGCGEGGGGVVPQDDACARPTCEAVCEGGTEAQPVAVCECGGWRWSEVGGRPASIRRSDADEQWSCYPDGSVARHLVGEDDEWFTPSGEPSTFDAASDVFCRAWKAEGAPFSCE